MSVSVDMFMDELGEMPRPAVLNAFDDLTGEIEEAYPEALELEVHKGAQTVFTGPQVGVAPRKSTRSYTGRAGGTVAEFDVTVRDYSQIFGREENVIVVPGAEPDDYRRDIRLEYTGDPDDRRAVTCFDLIGDTVYDLFDGRWENYDRSENPPRRMFTFRRDQPDV